MAAYQTGVSSSPVNLLQTLVSWLSSQSWVVDLSMSIGTGWRAHLHKGATFVHLRAAMDEKLWAYDGEYHDKGDGGYGIGFYLGTSYNGMSNWDEQPGRPVRVEDGSTCGCGVNLPAGSVAAYHLFDDGADNIIVVVERTPGIYCHFGWGPAMGAAGQPENFPYFFGSASAYLNTITGAPGGERGGINITTYPPFSHGDEDVSSYNGLYTRVHATAYVRVDAGTYTARWIANGRDAGSGDGGYGGTGRQMRCALNLGPCSDTSLDSDDYPSYQDLADRVHQTAFAGALFLPLHTFVLTDPDARWSPVGHVPSVFWCEAVGHGHSPGDVYQVGGEDYMLFPHFAVRKGA